MKRLKKTLVLAITLSFAALYLMACTGNGVDTNAGNEASVEASAADSENGTTVEDKKDNSGESEGAAAEEASEAANAVTAETATEATSTADSNEGVSFEKVEDGKGGDNALDASTVDVSVGEPYDTDPVPVPTDPTLEPR